MNKSRVILDNNVIQPLSWPASTFSVGADAQSIDSALENTFMELSTAQARLVLDSKLEKKEKESLAAELFSSSANFKVRLSQVAMHLREDWRIKLFEKIDFLLSEENWDDEDLVVSRDSHATAIRTLIYLNPNVLPSLGASHEGNLLFGWKADNKVISLECWPDDIIHWAVVVDDSIETSVGKAKVSRIKTLLQPYNLSFINNGS